MHTDAAHEKSLRRERSVAMGGSGSGTMTDMLGVIMPELVRMIGDPVSQLVGVSMAGLVGSHL